MAFTLPELPYPYDALAPTMSRETLEFHHDKHHAAYVTNGNNLAKGTEWENKPVEEVVKGTFGKNAGLFNNAAQHYNHIHFWKWMKKGGGGDKIPAKLEKQITSDIGPIAKFKEDFIQAGVTQFGSGWCWLAVKDGKLAISKTPNGENPLVHGGTPRLPQGVLRESHQLGPRRRDVRSGDEIGAVTTMRARKRGLAPRFLQPTPFRCPRRRPALLPHCARRSQAASVRGNTHI
jgi:Fe-Mn family superoxide dismutase